MRRAILTVVALSLPALADPAPQPFRPKPRPPVLCIYTDGKTQCWAVMQIGARP